jgi:protein-disulfide isomerase
MEKNNLTVPVAIVVAGLLVAGAIFITRGGAPARNTAETLPNIENVTIDPVIASDHILGNPNAEIMIVEYSDTECPFCKEFHNTMHAIIDKYGKDGKVAWVYRHFALSYPSDQAPALHPKAAKEAEASECAADLGGNDKFWAYIDEVYNITPSNNGLDAAELPKIAERIGLNRNAFETCLASGKFAQKVRDAYDAALEAGASGTPYSVIVTKSGSKIPITGAQPLRAVDSVIQTLLTSN